jgi:hypothetical protein
VVSPELLLWRWQAASQLRRGNLAAGHLQFHPLPQDPAAAILSGLGETILASGDY